MGLGSSKKRTKLSHDPNNTHWSGDVANFGHKMLLSQGWTPGSNLGAIDAPHAHLHTSASFSHIRVALKDDNLGLGAKRGSGILAGECTGLDVFQSLLGRLNGKNEETLETEQRALQDLKRARYVDGKFGTLHFVSGGVLVGDKIQDLIEGEKRRVAAELLSPTLPIVSANEPARSLFQSKKPPKHDKVLRKTFVGTEPVPEIKKGLQGSSEESCLEPAAEVVEVEELRDYDTRPVSKPDNGVTTDKAERMREKAQRKLDRRKRKVARAIRRAARAARAEVSDGVVNVLARANEADDTVTSATRPLMPVVSRAVATMGGRHAVRQRYIMQKRRAVMDPKALNEIFMIKT